MLNTEILRIISEQLVLSCIALREKYQDYWIHYKKVKMIGLTCEITDEINVGRRELHLHLCPQIKQV